MRQKVVPVVVVVSSVLGGAGSASLAYEQHRGSEEGRERDRVTQAQLAAIGERLARVETDLRWVVSSIPAPQQGQTAARLPTR